MEAWQSRVESWIRDQSSKIRKVSWGTLQWRRMRWTPWNPSEQREQRKRIQLEYERRKKQLNELSRALQAESVSDLQDILCCMVLSECVYKVRLVYCSKILQFLPVVYSTGCVSSKLYCTTYLAAGINILLSLFA